MTSECRSQAFPGSAGSREILLQHYLYFKRRYKLKVDKTSAYMKRKG